MAYELADAMAMKQDEDERGGQMFIYLDVV